MGVAKTKASISFHEADLRLDFAFAKIWFSHVTANIIMRSFLYVYK